jgi:hypothetical protein
MVQARAAELAIIDGHLSHDATASHFAQAKRELTGVPDTDPRDAILDSAPANELPPKTERHKMKSNAELQQDVQDAIKWQPLGRY